ncbi:MAG: pyridoxal 5'-phosphate synthase glutaminase subunit PdxT, partial [Desulfurococcaceae archaeon]
MVTIGVLALQGDFLEHLEILREIGVNAKPIKKSEDLSGTDALVIPGGESTTIGTLMKVRNLIEPVIKLAESDVPILGTCAGAVLMAKKVVDRVVGETGQVTLGLMDISVVRNVFGRQKNSFITDVEVEGMGIV